MHYRFHPLTGRRGPVLRWRRERAKTYVYVPGPDGAPLAVPEWMEWPRFRGRFSLR